MEKEKQKVKKKRQRDVVDTMHTTHTLHTPFDIRDTHNTHNIHDIHNIHDVQDIHNIHDITYENTQDIIKKHSLVENCNNRIYRNKYKYLKNIKEQTFLLFPNIKKKINYNEKKSYDKKLKHEIIEIERMEFEETCNDCNVLMKIILSESVLYCSRCGKSKQVPIYSLPPAESDFFVPKTLQNKSRIIDWLLNVQGNDPGEVNKDIVKELCEYIYKNKKSKLCESNSLIAIRHEYQTNGEFKDANKAVERLKPYIPGIEQYLKEINSFFIKQCWEEIKQKQQYINFDTLECVSLKKAYDKSSKYSCALSGYKALQFTNEQEEKIKLMYSLAYPTYEGNKEGHKNWPGGYAYFLKSLCALLGYDEFLDSFDITSNNIKIKEEREEFRKKIWKILGWEYFSLEYPIPPMILSPAVSPMVAAVYPTISPKVSPTVAPTIF